MARNGEQRKTNVEESKRERVGGGEEVLSPSLQNPAPSPFFLAHFSFRFPNDLKACYRLLRRVSCVPSFPTFYGIYSTWASSTFGALLLISRNGFGSTNFLTAFWQWNCHFFLSCFLSIIFSLSISIVFLDVFFASLPSLTHSPLPPPSAPDNRERPFILLQTIRSTIPRSWLTRKVRAFLWYENLCTDWRFSVMETLAVILNCRWQVKRLKVHFNSVWKENIVFSAKEKK